jgi:hypothetical protein
MQLIRYEVKSTSGKSYGICTGGHDLTLMASRLNISFDAAENLWKQKHKWLTDPGVDGQYFFTNDGDILFSKELYIYEAALHKGWTIERTTLEAEDTPIYQDKYQVVF